MARTLKDRMDLALRYAETHDLIFARRDIYAVIKALDPHAEISESYANTVVSRLRNENPDGTPSWRRLIHVAKALGVRSEWLLHGELPMEALTQDEIAARQRLVAGLRERKAKRRGRPPQTPTPAPQKSPRPKNKD